MSYLTQLHQKANLDKGRCQTQLDCLVALTANLFPGHPSTNICS